MITTKHTPGTWRTSPGGQRRTDILSPCSPYVVAQVYSGPMDENHADNAERIVKCVNALDGVEDPAMLREQYRVMRAALAGIASIPKQGEPEEDGSNYTQTWDDEGGRYAVDALHNAIDKARAVIDATKEG